MAPSGTTLTCVCSAGFNNEQRLHNYKKILHECNSGLIVGIRLFPSFNYYAINSVKSSKGIGLLKR